MKKINNKITGKREKQQKLFIDRCFAQAFEEASLTKEEFSDACTKLNLQPCLTSPTGIREYSDANINHTSDLGSETWAIVESSDLKTYTKGEDEAIAIAEATNNAWIGTFDKRAVNKCKRRGINYIDHITFLLSMVEVGTINMTKAASIYKNWGTNIPKKYPTLKKYIQYNKNIIKEKFKLLKIKYV